MKEKEEKDFYYKYLSCCSLKLYWKDNNNEQDSSHSYEYELYKNQEIIYKGKKTYYRVVNLKPNEEYIFELIILKSGKIINQNENKSKIKVTTLKSPLAIISEKSVEIANGENIIFNNVLSSYQKEIIKNSSKLIFEKNEDNLIKGNFDGIEIKMAYEEETKINYISFDIKSNYLEEFLNKFVEECKEDIIIPCHFIIQKLPTILIFNLLEKGPIILTGKRIGGIIASSLAFYILSVGKKRNFGNTFIKKEQNCIGVVTFGSPSFLNSLTAADINKDIIPYFYNIKAEYDYIPEIIDYINNIKHNKNIISFLQTIELDKNDKIVLEEFLKMLDFTEDNLKNNIKNSTKIPFGYYYMMKNTPDYSLVSINEHYFEEFYYLKIFHSKNFTLNSKVYNNLSSTIEFKKESLLYLKNDSQLELIKIIRRCNKLDAIKGIIKFKLNDNIPPDIIDTIILKSTNKKYEINNKYIYYDNNTDITAYIDDLNENINEVIIMNNFGGKIKIKNILNIKGSGETRKMLKDNIEKLFLFPYFKLIEIFYASTKENENFNDLVYEIKKKEYFGNKFEELPILDPFEKQIKALDKLLFLTRPDILGKFEKEFIREYFNDKLDDEIRKCLEKKFHKLYELALLIQKEDNINCLDSQKNSFAKKYSFPQKIKAAKGIKKLFMFNRDYFENSNFILQELDDTYIKVFFIKQLIKESLQKIESEILNNISNKTDEEIKKYLSDNINKFYQFQIIPNIDFIYILILSSIESGDEIKFNHNLDWKNLSLKNMSLSFLIMLIINSKGKLNYEKDFEKYYKNEQIEALHMKNLFNKTKTKNIIKSNISQNINKQKNEQSFKEKFVISLIPSFLFNYTDLIQIKENKSYNFSEYSENQKYGKEYYEKFLELLNNYSNDFPEDIEISIYDNLKEENKNNEKNFSTIKEMVNRSIDDDESKKGFLALLRQSYLLGELRCKLVSIFIIYF